MKQKPKPSITTPNNFIYLEKHLPERNMHRYYRLYITSTLFGEYVLIREWGRYGIEGVATERLDIPAH